MLSEVDRRSCQVRVLGASSSLVSLAADSRRFLRQTAWAAAEHARGAVAAAPIETADPSLIDGVGTAGQDRRTESVPKKRKQV